MAAADISQILGAGIHTITSTWAIQGTGGEAGWEPAAQAIAYGFTTAGVAVTAVIAVAAIGPLSLALILVIVLLLVLLFACLIIALITFRQLLLIALVIVSPLAFVAMILPNTESLFKKWWTMFWKLLIIYPIFVFIRTICKAFSLTVGGW
jgi:hypothetical protein